MISGERLFGEQRAHRAAWVYSVAAHMAVLAAIVGFHATRPAPQVPPILVDLVELPDNEPPGPPAEAIPTEAPPAAPVISQAVEPTSKPAQQPSAPAEEDTPVVDTFSDVMSESQLAGAASASEGESGGGGGRGGCDIARVVQNALRRDPMVRNAVQRANRQGKSILLWDGDWVRTGTQHGKGLSGVREVIMWEVAFAPEACRHTRMQGLILVSLDDTTRFAIGSSDWRWSDLLGLRK